MIRNRRFKSGVFILGRFAMSSQCDGFPIFVTNIFED